MSVRSPQLVWFVVRIKIEVSAVREGAKLCLSVHPVASREASPCVLLVLVLVLVLLLWFGCCAMTS